MNRKSWFHQGFYFALLVFKASDAIDFEITVPSVPQLAIHGKPIVLDCSFPVGEAWDLDSTVITWQRGLEVVHSFYHGQDQLDRQSSHYVNRTSLYHSEMERGNASLRLENTTLGDVGHYTCSVSTLLGSEKKTFPLKLAAFYPEPHLKFTSSPGSLEVLLISHGGYPVPSVQWLDDSGADVTNDTHLSQDTQGLYTVSSTLTLRGTVNTALTFLLKNKDLGQEIRREITFQSDSNAVLPVGHQRSTWYIVLPFLLLMVVLGILILLQRKRTGMEMNHSDNGNHSYTNGRTLTVGHGC